MEQLVKMLWRLQFGIFLEVLFFADSFEFNTILPTCSNYRKGRCMQMSSSDIPLHSKIRKIAIIGAGAAGLAVAREFRKEFDVDVLEQSNDVGGVWLYTDDIEESLTDPLQSMSQSKPRIHSSLYRSLRTNLPREVMQYSDYPFSSDFSPLRYPHHTAVLAYLQAFARDHNLRPLIRFQRQVVSIDSIQVRTDKSSAASVRYAACNQNARKGARTHPRLASAPPPTPDPRRRMAPHRTGRCATAPRPLPAAAAAAAAAARRPPTTRWRSATATTRSRTCRTSRA